MIDGRMLATTFEALFRSADHPLENGYRVELLRMQVTVLELEDNYPVRLRLDFDDPLDNPALLFLTWRDGRLSRVLLPKLGQSLDLPHTVGPVGI